MAVLGVQAVITMITISFMSKFIPRLSFARWLLCSRGLVRYLPPSNKELRELSQEIRWGSDSTVKRKGNGINSNKHGRDSSEVFPVPRNVELQLENSLVRIIDLARLRYFFEYQWLVDFSMCALLVYIITEIYAWYLPLSAATETNLSVLWCFLAVGFSFHVLCSLTGLFFHTEESVGERSIVIVMWFVYLLIAMMTLMIDEDILETGLDQAYLSFNASASAFLKNNLGLLESNGPASKLVLKLIIAVLCAFVGSLFTFPGLRIARMQWEAFRYSRNWSLTLNLAFVAPLFLTTLWIKPLCKEYLTERVLSGMNQTLLTEYQFETLRILSVLVVVVIRLAIMPLYIQSYLNSAFLKVQIMKQEAGRTNNLEIQNNVQRVFQYLCVISLQYLAPVMIVFFLTLIYNSLVPRSNIISEDSYGSYDVNNQEQVFIIAWKSFKQIFSTAVFRGVLGFSTWWCCFVWFTSSALGICYQSYFSETK